LLYRSLL
jgi:hypothetical protein